MQRLGVSFEVREACLNHALKGVGGIYGRHDYAKEKAAAFEKLAAEVLRIVREGRDVKSNIVPLRISQ